MNARGVSRYLLLAAAAVSLLAGCAKPPPPEPPTAHTQAVPIYEEEVNSVGTLAMKIVDLKETPSPDHKSVTLTGTLINGGTRPTQEVYVHVEALDKDGAVLVGANSATSSKQIAPGGTGTFSVTFENRPDVESYHVEAVAR